MFSLNSVSKKFDDMNQYPLKVSIFYRSPSVMREEELPKILLKSYVTKDFCKYRFGGFDGIFLTTMVSALNFTARIVTPQTLDYGYKLPNNTYDGEFSA